MATTVRRLTQVHRLLVLMLFVVVSTATLLAVAPLAREAVHIRTVPPYGDSAIIRSLYLTAAITLDQAADAEMAAIRSAAPSRTAGGIRAYRDRMDEAGAAAERLVRLAPNAASRIVGAEFATLVDALRRAADRSLALKADGQDDQAAKLSADVAGLARAAANFAERRAVDLAASAEVERMDLDEWSSRALFHLYLCSGIGLCLVLAGVVAVLVLTPARLIQAVQAGLPRDWSEMRLPYPSRARLASYAFRWT